MLEPDMFGVLRGHAWRTGAYADGLARLAMRAAAGGGFVVARTALDELVLRFDRSTRTRTELAAPPRGWFAVSGHEVWLDAEDVSCDCDDFIRASLGACVHVLAAQRYGGV